MCSIEAVKFAVQTNCMSLMSARSARTGIAAVWCLFGGLLVNSAVDGASVTKVVPIAQYQFKMQLPDDADFELLVAGLEAPRVLHFSHDRLFVGSRSGKVYWFDPPYRKANVLVELDDYPHSVVVLDDTIFIARTSGIYAADYSGRPDSIAAERFQLIVPLPGGRGHNSRTLKIGPDRRLYVSLGISGNCSDEYLHPDRPFNQQRGGVSIVDLAAQPPALVPFASGLRNPVGFDWHPQTQMLYASNNGPDHSGFDEPSEVFARLTPNSFHGMPWYQSDANGDIVRDTCIASAPPHSAADVVRPAARFDARIAPMDVVFVTGSKSFSDIDNDALVALHGSWATAEAGRGDGDPSTRRPPKIVRVKFDQGEAIGVEDYITGFQLDNGARWMRPMGLAFGPDGHLYISSDGGIEGLFRLRRTPSEK
jgi:glucose/arabinose dehydrogenase